MANFLFQILSTLARYSGSGINV